VNLARIEVGDVVLVDKLGTQFQATVTEKRAKEISFEPHRNWVTYRTAKAREVVRRVDPPEHVRRSPRRRQEVAA
jgi:hypothetical protein